VWACMMSMSTAGPLESSSWFVGKMERVSAEQFLMEVGLYLNTCVASSLASCVYIYT
jgi:hypothetical protein